MKRLTIAHIQHQVAVAYGMDVRLMLSARQARRIARPRQVAMYLCVDMLPACSLPQIGRLFARDHTTVMHARRVVADLMAHDAQFHAVVESLKVAILAQVDPPQLGEAGAAAELAVAVSAAFRRAAVDMASRDPRGFLDAMRPAAEALGLTISCREVPNG